ncbi:hypothetical protein VTO42DRAFT_471 [Malbranchea cinnamomea]
MKLNHWWPAAIHALNLAPPRASICWPADSSTICSVASTQDVKSRRDPSTDLYAQLVSPCLTLLRTVKVQKMALFPHNNTC